MLDRIMALKETVRNKLILAKIDPKKLGGFVGAIISGLIMLVSFIFSIRDKNAEKEETLRHNSAMEEKFDKLIEEMKR